MSLKLLTPKEPVEGVYITPTRFPLWNTVQSPPAPDDRRRTNADSDFPTDRIQAGGNKPKLIEEYIGRVNSKTPGLSVAHMRSPQGWLEPGQTPQFDKFTIVLKGMVRVSHNGGQLDVKAGQAVIAHAGEWVRYSTPEEGGAEYIAVCLPAFSMETVHRDEMTSGS
jgi:ethanolamine utilization protein EutQ